MSPEDRPELSPAELQDLMAAARRRELRRAAEYMGRPDLLRLARLLDMVLVGPSARWGITHTFPLPEQRLGVVCCWRTIYGAVKVVRFELSLANTAGDVA